MEARPISSGELEVMRAWLAHEVSGATGLRAQLSEGTKVYRSCDCGCASIGFLDLDGESNSRAFVFDVDAEIVDEWGNSIGGMILTVRDGRLHDVDVHSWFGRLPFPAIDRIRWNLRI